MAAKQLSPMLWLLLTFVPIPSFTSDIALNVGRTLEGVVSTGNPQFFAVILKAQDYAQIKLDPHGKELAVVVHDPSGSTLRGAKLGPDEDRLDFVADRAGTYRIELAAANASGEISYAITLEKIVTLQERLAPLKPEYESPRIRALRASLEAGNPGSAEAFWKQIEKEGAPIIEPLPGDDKNMLVTFLWRGTPDTHNVIVLRLPYAGAAPDDYFMDRIEGTSVWYRTVAIGRTARFEYSLAPNVPRIRPIIEGIDQNVIAMIAAAARTDPLNPNLWRVDPQSLDPPEHEGRSVVEMPDAPAQPWLAEKPEVPAGQVEKHRFKSALLKNEREIAVCLPPGYSRTHRPYPLLVLFDEIAYLGDQKQIVLVPTPTILDNLIAAKRIPAMAALLVGNVPGARDRELPCNTTFADFLASELLPWARSQYNFTADPRLVIVSGSSFGGLAAACAGLHHPETFGNILCQSGSFHWLPPKSDGAPDSGADAEPNWVARQFIASPKLPLRFYLDAGSDEIDVTGGGNSILLATRTLRDVLRAKGYEVQYHEFAGGHDYLSWRGTLADGLIFLMADAPAESEAAAKP
jgi:enterochelin esterase-like enzyme